MNAIIFGINGQDGYYLSNLLTGHGVDVIGVSRSTNWIVGNVADKKAVENIIKENKPDFIFHLAANSTTSHDAVLENHETITTGTLNILEAVYRYSPRSKIFLSGSAVQFENKGKPINETTPFAPLSAYAVSRIASVYAGRYYRFLGLQVYVGYFFNHDSPLRTEKHVNQKIVKALQRIVKGSNEKLELGNIEVKKEFNFAGDIVNAVWKLVNQNNIHEAVIGCGKVYSIRQWLEYCFKKVNINWQDYVTVQNNFVPEYKILVSDPKLIMNLGWQPEIDFYHLADIMMKNNTNDYGRNIGLTL